MERRIALGLTAILLAASSSAWADPAPSVGRAMWGTSPPQRLDAASDPCASFVPRHPTADTADDELLRKYAAIEFRYGHVEEGNALLSGITDRQLANQKLNALDRAAACGSPSQPSERDTNPPPQRVDAASDPCASFVPQHPTTDTAADALQRKQAAISFQYGFVEQGNALLSGITDRQLANQKLNALDRAAVCGSPSPPPER